MVIFAKIFPKQGLKGTISFNFQKMAKWPNHFISGKQFQKRPNLADLAFLKAKWQPWYFGALVPKH